MKSLTVNDKRLSITGGTAIVAGTIIGAGMLTLPIISAGMWSLWTVFTILVSFCFMWISANMILEVNLLYRKKGASFNTLVSANLGKSWNLVNGLSVAFVLYVLCYAYISGGSSALGHVFGSFMPRYLLVIIFSLIFVFLIMFSVKAVGWLSLIFLIVMVLTLAASISFVMPIISIGDLFKRNVLGLDYSIFILATLPYFLTSFCFHASVPSLVKYCDRDVSLVRRSITYGMLIALFFYLAWILCIFGLLHRSELGQVYANGGNVEHLLFAIQSVTSSSWFNKIIPVFAFFSITTSFLGAGLGLFDYISDLFNFDESFYGRLKTACIAFIPPIIGSVFFPDGFILAIGFSGVAAAIWSVFIPALMVKSSREKNDYSDNNFKIKGGQWMIFLVILYSIIVGFCFILSLDFINVLPVYK